MAQLSGKGSLIEGGAGRHWRVAVLCRAVGTVGARHRRCLGRKPDGVGTWAEIRITQMGELKITLAQEALADAAASQPIVTTPAQAPAQETSPVQVAAQPAAKSASEPKPALKTDEVTVTLKPGEAREIKLEMLNNAKVSYEWSTTTGGPVNHDTHGEPYNGAEGYFHSYRKGQQVTGDKGEFTAIFDGTHGWFWRNRSKNDVTISLKTTGEYLGVKRVI